VNHPSSKRKIAWRLFKWIAFCLSAILVVAWISLPNLDGPHHRQFANEAASVARIREMTELQKRYSDAHPKKGFACEFALLTSMKQAPSGHESERFPVTGMRSGYRFDLLDCRPDQSGRVSHYQIVAVPIELGKTGFRTFCSDETRVIRYEKGESIEDCLSSRNVLE
jgi:hypothetical protein